jgi:proteasome activator subunit 4
VLDRLGRFTHEPQPLKSAVSRTFAEFKRTHQDNWAAHKQRLTMEQQEMLADAAVAPHWYA